MDLFNPLQALGALQLDHLQAAVERALADPRVRNARTPLLRKHLLLLRVAKEVSSTLPLATRLATQTLILQLPRVLKDSDPADLQAVGAILRDVGAVLAEPLE